MKPAPHEKCMVGITTKRVRNSNTEDAILMDASKRKAR
jgi:hypothetical protein